MNDAIIKILIEKMLTLDVPEWDRFIEGVHRNLVLDGFEDALFLYLYQNATEEARLSAVQTLKLQGQPTSFPQMHLETA